MLHRRERNDLDLKFDDDQERKKGKTTGTYEEYCDLWRDFETLKGFTFKRNQYVLNSKEEPFIEWVDETVKKLKKDLAKMEQSSLDALQTEITNLGNDDSKRNELFLKKKELNNLKTNISKKRELETAIEKFKEFEQEEIVRWKKMEQLMEELSQNEYVKSRFTSFGSTKMTPQMYKNGLYDLLTY
jgi:hypothetical protein